MRDPQVKCRRPRSCKTSSKTRVAEFVRFCTVEMLSHGHHTRASFRENLQEKSRKPDGARTGPSTGTAVVCKPAKSKCMVDIWQKPRAVLCKNFQENVTPKTATTVFCKPAQTKCTWTCHKSHFIRNFSSRMPQTKLKEDRAADFLRESVPSKCTWRCHKSQFLYENLQGKGHAPRPGKPFCASEFSGKLPQTKIKDGSRGRLCASLRSRNAHKSSQEYFMRLFCGKMRRPETRTNKQCARACAVQIPLDMQTCQKSHIMREFSGKMPQANIKQTPRRRLCASLRSRNAHGHRTRASLCENLQERSRKPDGAP